MGKALAQRWQRLTRGGAGITAEAAAAAPPAGEAGDRRRRGARLPRCSSPRLLLAAVAIAALVTQVQASSRELHEAAGFARRRALECAPGSVAVKDQCCPSARAGPGVCCGERQVYTPKSATCCNTEFACGETCCVDGECDRLTNTCCAKGGVIKTLWGGCCPKERMCSSGSQGPFCCPSNTMCFNGVCKDARSYAWLASCASNQLVRSRRGWRQPTACRTALAPLCSAQLCPGLHRLRVCLQAAPLSAIEPPPHPKHLDHPSVRPADRGGVLQRRRDLLAGQALLQAVEPLRLGLLQHSGGPDLLRLDHLLRQGLCLHRRRLPRRGLHGVRPLCVRPG